MSYRNYMPWARSIVSNDKSNNNKKSEDQSATEPTENKENTQDTGYRSRYGLGFSSVSSAATTSRTTDSSNSASNYRPGSYRASLTPSSYTARDRSVSGDRYTSTYVPKSSDTPSYSRTSYSRSNSTLSDRETGDSEKKNLTSGAAYSSYSRYGRSPSRTVSYDTLEEKPSSSVNNSPSPRTESSAFKYPSSSYSTNPISSRFLSNRKDSSSTEKLTNTEANTEGRYTYRTRPQPAVKKLEIPVKSKPEVVISPTSPLSPTLPPIPKKTEFRFEPEPVELQKNVPCTISVVTRGTSPNPPSSFLRTRRSDLAREIQRDVARPQVKPETKHQYTQTEKVEDTSRFSRYGSRTSTPWSSYLDRYPSASSTYSPVSRYSSKFASTNAATESPKSSTMASRPSRLNIDTISNKSTVTAADELKDSINSLVATLQTSPLGTPICEIGPKSEELVKNSNSFKLNKKEKSPEKIKTGKKSKSPEKNLSLRKSPEKVKSRSPEKLRKSISPEKCKSAEVKSESTIKKSPSKSDSRKSPTKTSEVVKVSRSTSKINLGTRRSSKDEISEKQAVNASNVSKSVPSSAGNSPKISHKVNNLSQDSSKTDINNIENLSPQLKAKVPIPKSVSKDKIDKSPSKTGIFSRQSSIERSNSQNNACDTITNNKEDSKESILEKSRCTIIKKLNQNEGIEKEALLHGATNEQTTTLLSECVSVKVEPDLIVEQVKRQNNSRAASPRSKIEINSRNNSPRNSLERSPATTRKSPPNSPETSLKSGQKLPLDTISKKLPPPSPKSTNLKLSFSLNALPKPKIANKDFRKSPLNMNNENKDLTGIKEKKAMSAGNSPLCPHKPLKSTSTNSVADISRSSVNSSSHCLDIKESKPDSFNNSMNLSSSHNLMSSESNLSLNQANNLNNSNKQSPENIQKGNDCLDNSSSINPNAIQPKFIRTSSSLRNNSSSTSSEEDEEEESEEDSSSEDKEQNKNDCENKTNLKDSGLCRVDNESCEKIPINLIKSSSFRRSRSHLLSRTDSGTSEDPCSSLPVDPIPVKEKSNFEKPPLPPSLKPKEESTSKAASFLMRALAPVTNLLFVKKPEVTDKETHDGILEDLKRSETFQSISEIHDEVISDVPNKEPVNDLEQWLDKNEKISTKFKKKKRAKSDTNEKVQCISTNSVDLHENLNKTNKQLAQSEVVHENKSIKEEKETNEIFKEAANTAPEKESVSAMSVDGSESVVMRSGSEQPSSKIWERPISCEVGWWLKDDEKLLQSENNKLNVNPCESIAEGSNQMSNSLSKNSMEQSNSPEIIGDKALNENEEGQIVRKVFRSESGEHSWLIDSTEDISDEDTDESEEDDSGSEIESDSEEEGNQELPEKERKQFQFRKIASGDRAWWMQSTDNVPEGISRIESSTSLNKNNLQEQLKYRLRPQISGDRAKWMVSNESVSDSLRRDLSKDSLSLSGSESRRRIKRIESGEKAWWMQSNENIPDEIQRNESTNSVSKGEEPVAIRYRIRPQQSGERSWWMQSTENIPEGVKRIESNSSLSKVPLGKRIRRIESGEKAWWMQSQDNVALNEGVKRNASIRSLTKHGEKGLKKSDSVRSNDSKLGRRVRRIESGEKAWWMDSNSDIPEGVKRIESSQSLNELKSTESRYKFKPLRPQVSGDRPWWLDSNANVPEGITRLSTSSEDSEEEESSDDEPDKQNFKKVPKFPLSLEERTSPDGLDANHGHKKRASGGRSSPYDNVGWISGEENGEELQDKTAQRKSKKNMKLFIGSHTNIDDILGKSEQPSAILSPIEVVRELTERFQMKEAGIARQVSKEQDDESEEETASEEEDEDNGEEENEVARATETATSEQLPRKDGSDVATALTLEDNPQETLDDASLQLYKDGDYGSYLDLEASLSEQHEEFEGFHLNRKNSIVLRTQLSVRVHTIIEKLLNSEGRELRRALFSLKQIFQEDKDLVHEFVQNDGLACLVKVGSGADQNFQNYILRALGQVMLYVDGMNGVMAHNETVQWLYALIASPFRLVVKTALKLLLVFVEYKESNCMLLIRAIHAEDKSKNKTAWSNVMKLLSDYDTLDTELLVYACSLINKTLNGLPDQDTYYDQVDALEEQGMEAIIQRYMSKQGTDLDLLRQFQIYEAVLHHEDGEEKGTPLRQLDEAFRKTLRSRKSSACDSPNERRKSRRHSSAVTPIINGKGSLSNGSGPQLICSPLGGEEEGSSSSSRSSPSPSLGGDLHHLNGGSYGDNNKANAGVTPALRRRRERAERQRSFIREQQESAAILKKSSTDKTGDDEINNGEKDVENWQPGSNNTSRTPSRQDILMNAMNKMDSEIDSKDGIENVSDRIASFQKDQLERGELPERKILQLNRENTVKDLTQMLSNSNIVLSPSDDKVPRIGDMTGIISKAMEGLAKSKSKGDIKTSDSSSKIAEIKKSETELQWENLLENMSRPLTLCDLDFTDLNSDDELDILAPSFVNNGIPPPPPPISSMSPMMMPPPPPGLYTPPAPPGAFGSRYSSPYTSTPETPAQSDKILKKSKKTVKLFWKEVREDPAILDKLQKTGLHLIWDELSPVAIDTQKLEHLFESRAKDIAPKKQQEINKSKEIIVLDPKRSNAINIGMTKLPPPRSIKTAILKMDSTVMNREGIEKLFAMLPTEEERSRIQEAQVANPDIPLGSAEQFLLTLASITELPARLKLWAFKLDYENIEKEVAEPVMDLKQGMEILKLNKTFRNILGTLLSIGSFLNGNEVKGFQIEYLAKVPEVKDTVHKHSLLHHLCHMVMEKFPESTDLYSEIGAITRASKVDFDEISNNINRLESECKASWDHLKVIAKHDGSSATKNKMSDFLTDCAQRIILLGIIHRRVLNRFHNFLLCLGTPPHKIQETKPNEFCRILSEFALEYRTTRERVIQQLEKKANHRERNKTRGKMITEVGKFRTANKEVDRKDAELRQLLGGDMSEAESIGTWRRQRKDGGRMGSLRREEGLSEQYVDGDDELLESLVKTATKSPATRTTPRERKRTRHADLRRTLKNGLSEEEKKHLAAYIKGY